MLMHFAHIVLSAYLLVPTIDQKFDDLFFALIS